MLWWGNETPRIPIEVKNQVTRFGKIKCDIDRLKTIIRQKNGSNTFEFAIMCFYSSTTRGRKLKHCIEKIETDTLLNIGSNYNAEFSHRCFDIDNNEVDLSRLDNLSADAWSSTVIIIKYKPL